MPPDYEALLREMQRQLDEMQGQRDEERRQFDEERRQLDEERRQLDEERHQRMTAEEVAQIAEEKTKIAEEKTQKTTLPEFIDACHSHFHANLTVQLDPSMSTQGDPANADHKFRPERILPWEDFGAQQTAIWNSLMECELVSERHFNPLIALEVLGNQIKQQLVSSERDLLTFQRTTVEASVTAIIQQLFDNPTLRRKFGLKGTVTFENHANTLTTDMEQMTVSEATEPATPTSARPATDQFCVYNESTHDADDRAAAFILEYKVPHKLPLNYIDEGLHEMELADIIQQRKGDTQQVRRSRLIAAVITQAFSYMVGAGSKYGCVCTGEASIFLQIPEDPRTVYYYLSAPKVDMGATIGWPPGPDGKNRLHLTAVAQMLAFTLQAVQTPPLDQKWRKNATTQLSKWKIVYEDLLATARPGTSPSSEYQPPKNDTFLRASPIQLRPRPRQTGSSCKQFSYRCESGDEESDPDTPSRQPSSKDTSRTQATASGSSNHTSRRGAQGGQYCTQDCLRGLVEGGPLDLSCPNVQDHGESHHQIDWPTFLVLLRQQLATDLDTNCMPVSQPGACGVLFQIRLASYGYTVAAKATPIDFVHRLRWEATIYKQLLPIQGSHVPVYLGSVDLETPYYYEGIAELVHMLLLSFGGKRISQHLTSENMSTLIRQVDYAAQEIHGLGVLHRDLMPRNILWNKEAGQVMVIDFERSKVVKPQPVLGTVPANRESTGPEIVAEEGVDLSFLFAEERKEAARELEWLISPYSLYRSLRDTVV